MGKYKNQRRRDQKRRAEGGGSSAPKRQKKNSWTDVPIDRSNALFEAYYKGQGPEYMKLHEWGAFITALRNPLPTTFRINDNCIHKNQIKQKLKKDFQFELGDVRVDGHMIAPPREMKWFPDGNGWQLGCGKKLLRKADLLKKTHQFLVIETDSGNISRQEAVSMIPPLLMDVKPHHLVLDMCAAPGSKTAQLLECLAGENGTDVVPEGMVIANDADSRRAYMLTHQVKRIKTAGLVVTCHQAQFFPNLIPRKDMPFDEKTQRYAKGIFDRILADVPCSGDGTFRKNLDLWRKWDTSSGIALHPLQLQIAMRGCGLLKVGGHMVYSTCSFNPVENEAVVAEILRRCGGSMELVDAKNMLPHLKRRPGLHSWRVAEYSKSGDGPKELVWYDNFDSVPDNTSGKNQIRCGMFPPPKEEAERLHLERCWRMLPHDQDTGGFFVALLRKVKDIEGPEEKIDYKPLTTAEKIHGAAAKKIDVTAIASSDSTAVEEVVPTAMANVGGSKEEVSPVPEERKDASPAKSGEKESHPAQQHGIDLYAKFMGKSENRKIFESIKNFYGIDDKFPTDNLFTRSDGAKVISFVNDAVKLNAMDFENKGRRLQLVNVGLKCFERNTRPSVDCSYRLLQDGIGAILPFMNKRVIPVNLQDMAYILGRNDHGCPTLAISTEGRKALENIGQGSCVTVLDLGLLKCTEQNALEAGLPNQFAVVCWLGGLTLSPLVHKLERDSFYNTICTAGQALGIEIKKLEGFKYPNGKIEGPPSDISVTKKQ